MSAHDEDVIGKAYDSRLMKRLLGYLRPYKPQVALALVAIITSAVLQLAPPYLTRLAIDHYIAQRDMAGLPMLAAAYCSVLVGGFLLEYLQTWVMQMTGQRIMFDLRREMYAHLQRLDLRFYDRNPVGRLMTRVTSDVDVAQRPVHRGRRRDLRRRVHAGRIMIVMLGMNWKLALASFVVLPLIFLVTQWFRRNVRESYRVVRGWIARINAFLQENLTGMLDGAAVPARAERTSSRFDTINKAHRDANIDSIFYYAVFYPAIEIVGALAASIIIWLGGLDVMSGTLTLGVLVAFLQYSARFYRPISDMSEKFNILQSAMASSERIFTLLDTPVAVMTAAAARDASPARCTGHIVFDHVWFAYNGEDWVLQDVSFEVEPGPARRPRRRDRLGQDDDHQPAAAVLRRPAGTDSRRRRRRPALDLAQLAALFALVLQDVHLFSGTIAENIRLGEARIDESAGAPRGGGRPRPPVHRGLEGRLRRARAPSAARRSRRARSSCSRSRARWRSTGAC